MEQHNNRHNLPVSSPRPHKRGICHSNQLKTSVAANSSIFKVINCRPSNINDLFNAVYWPSSIDQPIAKELARELYSVEEEHEDLDGLSDEQREHVRLMRAMDRAQETSRKGLGRPTKKERRDIGKVRGK